jgi:hypothetical protein
MMHAMKFLIAGQMPATGPVLSPTAIYRSSTGGGITGTWYAQKTEGNLWQADFTHATSDPVTYVDWGDNVESVQPKLNAPFRLEVTLYTSLDFDLYNGESMTGYTMAVLAIRVVQMKFKEQMQKHMKVNLPQLFPVNQN